MKLQVLSVLAVCLLACGCGASGNASAAGYTHITQEEAKQIMDTEADIIILDVRTEQEFAEGHIPGAVCVPVETIADEQPQELPDLNQKILVYCRSGNRSRQASEKLAAIGYTQILEFGGINSWPYETVKD